MITDKGVYTTKCPSCTRLVLVHVLPDRSISPNKCAHCEMMFAGIEKGEVRNTFDIVSRTNKFNITVKSQAEEHEDDDKNTVKSLDSFKLPKKISNTGESKKIKNSFKWQ